MYSIITWSCISGIVGCTLKMMVMLNSSVIMDKKKFDKLVEMEIIRRENTRLRSGINDRS